MDKSINLTYQTFLLGKLFGKVIGGTLTLLLSSELMYNSSDLPYDALLYHFGREHKTPNRKGKWNKPLHVVYTKKCAHGSRFVLVVQEAIFINME